MSRAGSKRSAGRNQAGREAQVGQPADQVVIAVIVEHAEPASVGERGDQRIDRRRPATAATGRR